jgi:hypothetical protein
MYEVMIRKLTKWANHAKKNWVWKKNLDISAAFLKLKENHTKIKE